MNITVSKTKVKITDENEFNAGEYNLTTCIFEFDEVYNDLEKRAIFTNMLDEKYLVEIVDNKCIIPELALKLNGKISLGVYAYENEEDNLKLRYSPEPDTFEISRGSYVRDAKETYPARPVEDLINEYNQNAINKTNEFNQNVVDKINYLDNHFNEKVEEFDRDVLAEIDKFNEDYEEKVIEFNQNAETKTNEFNDNAIQKTNEFNNNADNRTDELNDIAEGIEDMTTAIQFATFMIDDDMHLYIVQADRLKNTNFIFNEETGRLGVKIV